MPNFKEHLICAAIALAIVEAAIITFLVEEYYLAAIFMVLFFLFGSILPDVDLHHKRWFTVGFVYLVFPFIGYLIVERATHWGRIHSIGFGLILSTFVAIELSLFIAIDNSLLLAGSLFVGFLFHLIVDQIYHEMRLKSDPRVALKIWSNSKYDPLVRLWKLL